MRDGTKDAWLIAALVLGLLATCSVANAQNQPTDCSGTVGASAANITFRAAPQNYVFITNPSATASLWISLNGTAAANASGSFPLLAAGNSVTLPAMPTVSIIASAGSTPYTCSFR